MGPRGFLKFVVSRLLEEEPRSGYDLMKEISERTFGAWHPSSGAIYPTLMEMEDQGLIEEVRPKQGRQPSERRRKVYRSTPKGEEYLKKWVKIRHELRSKMFGWRRMWNSFWTTTPEEMMEEIQEAISSIEARSKEVSALPKERIRSLKKELDKASKRLKLTSESLKV